MTTQARSLTGNEVMKDRSPLLDPETLIVFIQAWRLKDGEVAIPKYRLVDPESRNGAVKALRPGNPNF